MNMFTIFDKCYHRPRTCDMLQELRDIQTKLQELKKKEHIQVSVLKTDFTAFSALLDWIDLIYEGRTELNSDPRYMHNYVTDEQNDPHIAVTDFLFQFSDYIKQIAEFRRDYDDYNYQINMLKEREIELKKQLGIK